MGTFGSAIRTTMLLGLLTLIFLGVGFFFAGISGMIIGLIVALVMNVSMYWFSDKIVLKMYKAQPLKDAKILAMIEDLSRKADIPVPKAYIIDTEVPNAFATGRNPKNSAVAVTKGLISTLKIDEIEGVLAHELGHVKNRDTLINTLAATMAGALTWLGYLFLFGGDDDRNAIGFILAIILAPIAASLIQLAISRSREYNADHTGGLLAKPKSLANALRKISAYSEGKVIKGNVSTAHMFIVNPFSAKAMANLFATHPPTEERIRRLEAM